MKKKSLWYFIKRFRKNSVFVRNLLLFFVVLMIPMLIFGYYLLGQTTALLKEQHTAVSVSMLERIADGIEEQLAETEYMLANTGYNDAVHKFLFATETDADQFESAVVDYLKTYVSVKKYVDSMYVYSLKSETIIDNHSLYRLNDFKDRSWISHINGLKLNDTVLAGRKKDGGYLNCITVIKPVYITPDHMNGVVVANLSIKELVKSFEDIEGVENAYIVQSNGNTIYCGDRKKINHPAPKEIMDIAKEGKTEIIEGKSYNIFSEKQYVSGVSVENYKMHILSLIPESYYSEKVQNVRNNIILIYIILIFIGIMGVVFVAVRSFNPIKSIFEMLSGDDINADIAYVNEILTIENKIKKNLTKNEVMNRELQAQIKHLRDAQLTALQAQINPHFLYNTLENLNWLAFKQSGGKNDVSDGLIALSQMFRETAKDERYIVTIAEEINLTQFYLSIVQIRFGDIIRTEIDIPPELYQTPVVKLSFQPLIENAIQHGIKPKGKGIIKITGRCDGNIVEITIDDNGIGMCADSLEELNLSLTEDYINYNDHIGLRNTNKRIKLVFGEEYGIRVSMNDAGGLRIRILLPRS